MGYINFEEEKATAKKQIKKRKINNQNLSTHMNKNRNSLDYININTTYSFKENTEKIIGKKGLLDEKNFKEIVQEDIINAKFIKCKFSNVKFKECSFIGCIFDECSFDKEGVIFENCIFLKSESDKLPSTNREDNIGTSFYNCDIYAKFLNCDLSFIIFENCKIHNTNFELSFIKKGMIIESELKNIKVIDCNLSGFKAINSYLVDFNFDDNYMTKFDENTFFDKIKLRYKDKQEYEGIYMTYKTLADKFKENSLNNNFGEYYYLAKCTQRKCVKILPKLSSYIYWFTCGYGERPEFCIISSLTIIIIFSFIYIFTGIEIRGEIISYRSINIESISIMDFIKHFNEALNLSIGMFGGVGTNNSKPIEISYMIANIEMIIGIIMMGLGIGTLSRKVIR